MMLNIAAVVVSEDWELGCTVNVDAAIMWIKLCKKNLRLGINCVHLVDYLRPPKIGWRIMYRRPLI